MYKSAPSHSSSANALCAIARWAVVWVLLYAISAGAQDRPKLFEDCTVHILNQAIHVSKDGGWTIPNIPTNGGLVRARLYCNSPFGVRQGQSDYFTIQPNITNHIKAIPFAEADPGPTRIRVDAKSPLLTSIDEQVQLSVTGSYSDGTTKDLATKASGTNFRSSNPKTASVSDNGMVVAHKSGSVIIAVWNEGITTAIQIRVEIGKDTDGDGLPDDYEIEVGLDPNDPVDALVDHDADNLNALKEFAAGTNPFSEDTDGDTIPDGEEVVEGDDGYITSAVLADTDGDLVSDNVELQVGTDPTDAQSLDLDASLLVLLITPKKLTIYYNPLIGEASEHITVTGVLLDGKGIDLTDHPQTSYETDNKFVVLPGITPGEMFAGQEGKTKITARVATHETSIPVTVENFEAKAVSSVDLGCLGRRVRFVDGDVLVACGKDGIRGVSLNNLNDPTLFFKNSAAVKDTYTYKAWDMVGHKGLLWVAVSEFTPKTAGETVKPIAKGGLVGVKLNTPIGPDVVTSLDNNDTVREIDANSTHLFVGSDSGKLYIINPATTPPEVLSETDATHKIMDVSVDGDSLAIAHGFHGLTIMDVSEPTAPKIEFTGTINNIKIDALDLKGELLAAAGAGGLTLIGLADTTKPEFLSMSGAGQYAFKDVSLQGNIALGADKLQISQIAVVNTSNPKSPFFAGLIDFSEFIPRFRASASDTTPQLIALSSYQKKRLYIGQHNKLFDNGTIAPICTFTTPLESAQVVEGATISVKVSALDDVMVDKVVFSVNGEDNGTDLNAPFAQLVVLPKSAGEIITLEAKAIDLAGNVGTCPPIPLILVEDPMTKIVGNIVNKAKEPIAGASVKVFQSTLNTTSGDDGQFTIENVPTTKPLHLLSTATVDDKSLGGGKGPFHPNPYVIEGSNIDVGDIILTEAEVALFMGPVVAATVLFRANDPAYPDHPPKQMGPVTSAPVVFESFSNAYGKESAKSMGPVVSQTLVFESFAKAYDTNGAKTTGPVMATPILFDAFNNAYPKTKPDGCGIITAKGCCEGTQLQICLENKLVEIECGGTKPFGNCGWNSNNGSYACETTDAKDPSDMHPIACPNQATGNAIQMGPVMATTVLFEAVEAKDPCETIPCQNGGTCKALDNTKYECTCATGWSGTNCDKPACNNNGICDVALGESCAHCSTDCGSCCCQNGGGTGVVGATWTKGCGDQTIEQCVCAGGDFSDCCNTAWQDQLGCKDIAIAQCNLKCPDIQNGAFCGDGTCNASDGPAGENCATCPADCGSCCCQDGGGVNLPGATWQTGCGDAAIEACVCATPENSACCSGSWDLELGCTFSAQLECMATCPSGGDDEL